MHHTLGQNQSMYTFKNKFHISCWMRCDFLAKYSDTVSWRNSFFIRISKLDSGFCRKCFLWIMNVIQGKCCFFVFLSLKEKLHVTSFMTYFSNNHLLEYWFTETNILNQIYNFVLIFRISNRFIFETEKYNCICGPFDT